ncbi:MAG TPA: hypothetical protein PKA82_15020 [Pyrinomonadaceae bacterium]|nr:hypothetical protein [Pyrinomonadaceae bacterium]
MITRRSLFKSSLALAATALFSSKVDAQAVADLYIYNGTKAAVEKSPHCEALELVFQLKKSEIRDVETKFAVAEGKKTKSYVKPEADWWFDAFERRWDVQRPFEPGTIDSTHDFLVAYSINNSKVGNWAVNTKDKTVQSSKMTP